MLAQSSQCKSSATAEQEPSVCICLDHHIGTGWKGVKAVTNSAAQTGTAYVCLHAMVRRLTCALCTEGYQPMYSLENPTDVAP